MGCRCSVSSTARPPEHLLPSRAQQDSTPVSDHVLVPVVMNTVSRPRMAATFRVIGSTSCLCLSLACLCLSLRPTGGMAAAKRARTSGTGTTACYRVSGCPRANPGRLRGGCWPTRKRGRPGADGSGVTAGTLDMQSPGRQEYGRLSYAGAGSVPYQRYT